MSRNVAIPAAEDRRARVAALFDPYFTLNPIEQGPLNAFGPNLAFDRLANNLDVENDILLLQRIMPPAFRAMVCDDLKLTEFAGLDPLSVPVSLRSSRWQLLCDKVRTYGDLQPFEKNSVSQLLIVLGYYEAVWGLNAGYLGCERFDAQCAGLAYSACAARYIVNVSSSAYKPDDLVCIAEKAPFGSKAAFLATSRLLMFYGRFAKNLEETKHWRERNYRTLRAVTDHSSPFWSAILESRYWRSAAFLPVLKKDWNSAFGEMDLAEEFARSAGAETVHEQILYAANLYPVLQSKARLYALTGNHEEALNTTQSLVALDPLYSTAHVDLGQAFLAVQAVEPALDCFAVAAFLGPPVDSVAAFLAGRCCEMMDRIANAREFYRLCLDIDPNSKSAEAALL